MRITFKALNRHMQHVINDRYGDLTKLQEQLSTGKRLLRPSDDPVDVANTLKLRSKNQQLEQFKKNLDDGLAFMGIADTAMQGMNTIFQRLRELSIQGASDTIGADQRAMINKESEQLFRQVVALVDTNYKGDYVFGGTQTKIPPYIIESSQSTSIDDYTNFNMAYFDASASAIGDTVQLFSGLTDQPIKSIIPGSFTLKVQGQSYIENRDYVLDYDQGLMTILSPALLADVSPGSPNYAIDEFSINFEYVSRGKDIYGTPVSNRGEIQREIEDGIAMPINMGADELLTDPVTGNNIINTLVTFGQSLLQNDRQGISDSLDKLDSVFNTLLSGQSKNGSRINRFETTQDRNGNQFIESTRLQSELEDAEMAETVTKYMMVENIYNAALQSAAKVIQPSLVNYL